MVLDSLEAVAPVGDSEIPTVTCYMCSAPATSREHAPPLCFFPERKDLPERQDLRKNLITVPACSLHNLAASKDDEYALVVTVTHFEASDLGRHHFATKVLRALKRTPAFAHTVFTEMRPANARGRSSGATLVDHRRYFSVMDKVSRAVYYHHTTGQKLLGPLKIVPLSFRTFIPGLDASHIGTRETTAAVFSESPRHGANPDVFYYQTINDESADASALKLTFYGGFEILALWGGVLVTYNVPLDD